MGRSCPKVRETIAERLFTKLPRMNLRRPMDSRKKKFTSADLG